MPLPTLDNAESTRLICPFSLDDTARPAASSAGFTILAPELSLAKERANRFWLSFRMLVVFNASMFVLIIMAVSYYVGLINVTFFSKTI